MNGSHCKHGMVKTDCETCTTENIKRSYSSLLSLFQAERDWAQANINQEKERGRDEQVVWNGGYLYAVEHIAEILGCTVTPNLSK